MSSHYKEQQIWEKHNKKIAGAYINYMNSTLTGAELERLKNKWIKAVESADAWAAKSKHFS